MTYAIGALAGLAYGVIFGLIKRLALPQKGEPYRFMKRAYLYMGLSSVINVLVLLSIFFLRHLWPHSFEATLIGAAVGLSVMGKIFTRTFRQRSGQTPPEKSAEEPSVREMK